MAGNEDQERSVLKSRTCRGSAVLLAVVGAFGVLVLSSLTTNDALSSSSFSSTTRTIKQANLSASSSLPTHNGGAPDGDCVSIQLMMMEQKKKWTNTSTMLELALQARDVAIDKMKSDYSEEYFAKLFLDDGGQSLGGRTMFRSVNETTNFSRETFQRKLKIKILEVQNASRNCGEGKVVADASSSREGSSSMEDHHHHAAHFSRFVWTTAGHSIAAGHGNLFNETMTAVLERRATDVFSVIGIDFEARNFGIGGSTSGPEFALCMESIYGNDVDLITWDFGVSDQKDYWLLPFFAMRARSMVSHPVMLALRLSDTETSKEMQDRLEYLKMAEDLTCPVLYLDPTAWMRVREKLPDTATLSTEKVNALPSFVRDFKCGSVVEAGKPTCSDFKFSQDTPCPDRLQRVKWHPGWRTNAVYGNLLALFLMDSLVDALQELKHQSDSSNNDDPEILLQQLRSAEQGEFKEFQSSTQIPNVTLTQKRGNFPGQRVLKSESSIWRQQTMCRTALLPSQMRYLNLSMDEDFYKRNGTNADSSITHDNQSMSLVACNHQRDTCTDAKLRIDRPDGFGVRRNEGWRSLVVPTDNAKDFYKFDQAASGMIVACITSCPSFNDCPRVFKWKELNNHWAMRVNGQDVTTKYEIFKDLRTAPPCAFLTHFTKNESQAHFFQPNEAGQFIVEARVTSQLDAMVALSSVIIL